MNRYSLWRYLFLVVIIIFGAIYAAPNLYGEDPAIQITPKSAIVIPQSVTEEITASLNAQKLPFISVVRQVKSNSVEIRFHNTEDQLKAQGVVEATLGNKYTVVLNLAPRTPAWLQNLGAKPMRLGLDLRGGVHFLLNVDTKAMLKERENSDVHAIGKQLRDKDIRYAGIVASGAQGITIRFRDEQSQQQALTLINKNYPEYEFRATKTGFNLQGKMLPDEIAKMQLLAVQQNITTMRNRVNDLGVAEPVILQQGKSHISIDLPGIQDMARAKNMIGKVATIRLQLVDTENSPATAASTGVVPFGTTLYRFEGRPVLLKNQVILHGTSILNASTITGEDGRPAVSIRAGGSGVSLFNKMTSDNIGKPLATVYVETKAIKKIVNGKVVTSHKQVAKVINIATIQSALGNSFQVTGLDSMLYAKRLALLLRSGAYSAPVSFVQERLVGPSLGKENIRMGVLSCEVGALLVFIFMMIYYRIFGIVADLALILNLILLVAIMSVLGFTLTLPGIAGVVLTLGMAVDANVLINERIREELRLGMSNQAAIHAGYGRAFSTIVDANVTTLIVAVVLFALGTGAVQGFAVTLTIGLLISMFTSIFFTRALINLIYGRRQVDHLSIGIKIKTEKAG